MSRLVIWICAALWLACVVYGVVAYMQIEPEGSGFTRGSNRIATFFRWQAMALLPALGAYVIGRSTGTDGSVKLASRVPLWLSGGFFVLTILAFIGALIIARGS